MNGRSSGSDKGSAVNLRLANETGFGPVSIMEPIGSVKGFSGRLENFPLLDIIQMACIARRDGRFDITHKTEIGKVLLEKGQIICVETSRGVGEDALLEILCWETGR